MGYASGLTRSYLDAIDARLSDILAAPDGLRSLRELFSEMRGAFPSLVWERLPVVTRERLAARSDASPAADLSRHYSPELHPLDFEWYFTRDSVDYLADLLSERGGRILCLGVPTVAAAAAQRGYDVTLVDRNPLIVERLPGVLRTELSVIDVRGAARHLGQYDVVLFDSPWNARDTREWLSIAATLAKNGALIAYSLFPSLVRPNAGNERKALVEYTETIGAATIAENSLAYETPVFESEALRVSGISDAGNWRCADLVILHKREDPTLATVEQPYRPEAVAWHTYRVGPRVVKLRSSSGRPHSDDVVSPIPGAHDFAFDSVSARDPRRELIDVWTSRNRVAQVDNIRAFRQILEALESGEDVDIAVRRALPSTAPGVLGELEETLERLLG